MRLSRNVTNVFNWILDNLVPSFVRDSRILMTPLFYLLFGKKYKLFMNFKAEASRLSSQQVQDYYKVLEYSHIKSYVSWLGILCSLVSYVHSEDSVSCVMKDIEFEKY